MIVLLLTIFVLQLLSIFALTNHLYGIGHQDQNERKTFSS
jgi:hypothetical protein